MHPHNTNYIYIPQVYMILVLEFIKPWSIWSRSIHCACCMGRHTKHSISTFYITDQQYFSWMTNIRKHVITILFYNAHLVSFNMGNVLYLSRTCQGVLVWKCITSLKCSEKNWQNLTSASFPLFLNKWVRPLLFSSAAIVRSLTFSISFSKNVQTK